MRQAILFLFLLGSNVHGQEWQQLPPFPGTARDDAAAFTIGHVIHVGTGRDVVFALTNDWYAFDMDLQQWSAIAALPATGRQYCSTFTQGGYGYLFGGVDDTGPLNELWRYDPVSNTWAALAPLPAPGRYATVAYDNGLVCTGMLDGGVPTNECWKYAVDTDTWEPMAPVPGPARHRASGSGGIPLVVGGADQDGNALSDAYGYDAIANTWATAPALPEGRYGADATTDPGTSTTYVVAGASSATDFHNEAWSRANEAGWSPLPSFSGGPRRGGVIGFGTPSGTNDRIIYYGTGSDDVQRYSDWWSYTNLWNSIPEGSTARLTLFPNPSVGPVHLPFDHPAGRLNFTVTDATGRILMTGTATRTMDLGPLPDGQYMIDLSDGVHSHLARVTLLRP